jgi:hypothetical protein
MIVPLLGVRLYDHGDPADGGGMASVYLDAYARIRAPLTAGRLEDVVVG